jgi:hypothetical protein
VSDSVAGSGSALILVVWVRIGLGNADPDLGGKKMNHKNRIKAFLVDWTFFIEALE